MSITKLKLIDSIGQEYTLPKTFELRSDPTGRRNSLMEMAFTHGAKDVSDSMFMAKFIEISGKIWATSDAEYNVKWDALAEHLIKDNIQIETRGRRINLKKVVGITHDYPLPLSYPYGEVTVSFEAADPFWYTALAVQKEIIIAASPQLFEWDIGGQMETWPLITIANTNDNFDFTLVNKTDTNRTFQIIDPNAAAGTTIYIDCDDGTLLRGTTNDISKFSGLFLRLLGGRTNEFSYTGANCTLTMLYYESWI